MSYLVLFSIAAVLSLITVPFIKKLAFKLKVLDIPNEDRKIHRNPIPLLGGFAVFLSLVLTSLFYILRYHPSTYFIPFRFYAGIFVGALFLMIGGYLDDKYNLSPIKQIFFPIAAVLSILISGIGIGITIISNPFGGVIHLGSILFGIPLSAIFVFIFIMGMIYTTKFLDGMDGLASGISMIAGLTLFFLSLTPDINQSITASLAIIFSGALLGFLVYNFNPASIFLGESGSTLLGFILGTFAVLLGGKIATAVLVMGVPILDVAWVIARRLWYRTPAFKADRKHLHFRLLDIGFSQRQTVLILYSISAIFGFTAVFLQSKGKLIALLLLLVLMVILALATVFVYRQQHIEKPTPGELTE